MAALISGGLCASFLLVAVIPEGTSPDPRRASTSSDIADSIIVLVLCAPGWSANRSARCGWSSAIVGPTGGPGTGRGGQAAIAAVSPGARRRARPRADPGGRLRDQPRKDRRGRSAGCPPSGGMTVAEQDRSVPARSRNCGSGSAPKADAGVQRLSDPRDPGGVNAPGPTDFLLRDWRPASSSALGPIDRLLLRDWRPARRRP